MITNLHIKNIGIIDDLEIMLNQGMNVLTGETGAGKSLIIDSLAVISGGRFSKEMIRKGEEYSYVEINIYNPDDDNSIDGNIIVTREIYLSGRNICKINGRLVTVTELKNFMKRFIEIHSQNASQQLLDNSTHIKYLDSFIGNEITKLKEKYSQKYIRYNEINKELKINYGDEKERERKLDLLKYQLNEINSANLKLGEEDELIETRTKMLNAEKIIINLQDADNGISENVIDSIGKAIRSIEKIENIDSKYENTISNLRDSYYNIQEISREISGFISEMEFDENQREDIENRLDIISNLKRKYGNNVEEILKYGKEIEQEINRIENLEDYNNKLKNEKKDIQNQLNIIGLQIHELRIYFAKNLSDYINKELIDLEMKNAKINVKVKYVENEYFDDGKDDVKIYVKTNIGENENELSQIASGGEMSRIMLAIKKVVSDIDNIPIMVFDEIDTGISGNAANSVANKIKLISKRHQVICISHLPSIAAIADYNYFISKKVKNERTTTNIKLLNEEEILEEIARISSGKINEISLEYAKNLRNLSGNIDKGKNKK